ncbi:unnamed protein product, partial [Natator depressus]
MKGGPLQERWCWIEEPEAKDTAQRIPGVSLKKMKSLRQNLKEHGLLEDFLKKHPYNPASKYFPSMANEDASEPLTNYMD